MNAFKVITLTAKTRLVAGLFLLALGGCSDPKPSLEDAALTYLNQWFVKSSEPVEDDSRCHGLGLLKHPEFSCLDMQTYAANINNDTRHVVATRPRECMMNLCGDFFEIELESLDHAGNPVKETAVLKRDEGQIRLYWYRSEQMLEAYRAANPRPDKETKDPEQVAYDEITARYPLLYQYPPCYGVRATTSTLAGKLLKRDEIDVDAVTAMADQCGASFCFGLVGQKIAPLCPDNAD